MQISNYMQTNQSNNSSDFKWAMRAYQFGDFEKALPIFDRLINSSSNSELLALRGLTLQALDYHYDAIEDFNSSLKEDPMDAHTLYSLAVSKGEIGDIWGKFDALDEAYKIMGKSPEKYHDLYNNCRATLMATKFVIDHVQSSDIPSKSKPLRSNIITSTPTEEPVYIQAKPVSKQVKQKETSQTKSRVVNVVKLILLIPLTLLVYTVVHFIANLIFDIRKTLENFDLSHWGEKPSLLADIIANIVACIVAFELSKLIMKGYSLAGNIAVGVIVIGMNVLAILAVSNGSYELYRAIGPAISIIIALVYIFYKPGRKKY